ncbi:putative Heterokaryon incompatibility domain-containing protein [Seiridium cardinale]
MAPFVYEPLDTATRQIRLLDLLPGSGTIQCRLRHTSLAAHEQYEGLSYCWGVPGEKVKIIVNGFDFLVTPNLRTALQYLRNQGTQHTRALWVDALCINQSDIAERNTQVPLMRDIYMSCQCAIVWLGKNDMFTRSAFEAVEFMASKADSGEKFDYYNWRKVKRGEQQPEGIWWRIRGVAEILQSAAAFNSLFGRPWFTRVWVVQELALSPQAIVVCGVFQMDWELIRRAHSVSKTNFEVPNHLGTMLRFRNWPDNIPDDILSHMLMAWHKDSQDPKDKIYGLMGIESQGEQVPVEVDYGADNHEIFTRFTRTYLEITGNLQVLAICRGCKAFQMATTEVPSWAINHEYDRNKDPLPDQLISWSFEGWRRSGGFSTGGERRCQPSFSGKLLSLQGFQLDSVSSISIENEPAPAPVGGTYVAGVVRSWISAVAFSRFYLEARRISMDANPGGTYGPTRQMPLDAFWQTIHGGNPSVIETETLSRARKSCEDVDKILTQQAGWVAMGSFMATLTLAVVYLVMLIMSGILGATYIDFFGRIGMTKHRRFLLTDMGYIGLGPRETKVGDKIVILQGHRAPVVARPGQCWRVVGDCYIHGIMDGEAFVEDKCRLISLE